MANKAIILTKNIGQLPPDVACEKAMAGHNVIGAAFVEDGELIVQRQASPFDLETLKEFQNEYKGSAIITIFQTMDTPINEGNIQPFSVEEDGKTLLAVFIEGEYERYAKPKETASAERRWFDTAFMPLLKAYSEQKGEEASVKGFMDYLDDPAMRKTLEESTTGRGVIKVLAETGEIKAFSKGEGQFKSSWGEVSHGYSEGEFPATEKKASKFFGSRKAKAEAPPAEVKPIEEKPKETDKTVVHKQEESKKTETASITPVLVARVGHVFARPIAEIRKHDKRMKGLLMGVLGGLPKGWKSMDYFEIPKDKVNRNWELKDQTAISAALEDAKNGKSSAQQGLIPPKMQEDFKKIFLESSDIKKTMQGVQTLPSIEQLQSDENKHPTWYDKTGIHVQHTFNWPRAKLDELASQYLPLYKLRAEAITNMLIKQMHEHPKKEEIPSDDVVHEKSTTTPEQRQENLKNLNQDLVPKKKGFFGARKVA